MLPQFLISFRREKSTQMKGNNHKQIKSIIASLFIFGENIQSNDLQCSTRQMDCPGSKITANIFS